MSQLPPHRNRNPGRGAWIAAAVLTGLLFFVSVTSFIVITALTNGWEGSGGASKEVVVILNGVLLALFCLSVWKVRQQRQ